MSKAPCVGWLEHCRHSCTVLSINENGQSGRESFADLGLFQYMSSEYNAQSSQPRHVDSIMKELSARVQDEDERISRSYRD